MRLPALRNLLFLACAGIFLPVAPARAITFNSSTTFNGATNLSDQILAITTDTVGNYWVAGKVNEAVGGDNTWIAKYNAAFVLVVSTTLNGSAGGSDANIAIALDPLANFVYVTGFVNETGQGTNVWIAKYNNTLTLLVSSVTINGAAGGAVNDQGRAIAVDAGGSVYVGGEVVVSGTTTDAFIAKYNSSLVLQASTTFNNGIAAQPDSIGAVLLDGLGGVYLAGYVAQAAANSNIYVGKYTTSLVFQSSSTVDGGAALNDEAEALALSNTGKVRVAGYIGVAASNTDVWLAEYNTSLVLQTTATFNGTASKNDRADGLAIDSADHWYVAGRVVLAGTTSDYWAAEFTPDLLVLSSHTLDGSAAIDDAARGTILDSVSNMIAAGYVSVSGQNDNALLTKYTPSLVGAPSAIAFTRTDVGISTVQYNWVTTGATCYRSEMRTSDCNFAAGYTASSTTANTFALYGTTNPALSFNGTYCTRVAVLTTRTCSDGQGTVGAYTAGLSTVTLASIRSVRNFLPTPPGTASLIYSSTPTFQFSASTGVTQAENYLTTFTVTNLAASPYAFTNVEPTWDGSTRTFLATSETTWYMQVNGRNSANVHDSTRTLLTYVYDATPPLGTGFVSVNGVFGNLPETTWSNQASAVTMNLTVQDAAPGAGLNAVGYSSAATTGVVGLWHLDEGSGDRAANISPLASPSDVDGLLRGATVPHWVAGRFGKALNFSPSEQGILDAANRSVTTDPLDLGGVVANFTVSAWINLAVSTNTLNDKDIITRWNGQTNTGKYILTVVNGNQPRFIYQVGSTPFQVTGAAIPVNTWTQVAGVIDGTNGVGYLYVNGKVASSFNHGGAFTVDALPANPTVIGARFTTGSGSPLVTNTAQNYFDGRIDEVRVFSNQLVANGADEIARDYAAGLGWQPFVQVSTTAGASWVTVSTFNAAVNPHWTLAALNGQTTAQTLQVVNYNLTTSTSALTGSGGTNQVRYSMTDLAGNELSAGPYTILVDTTNPVSSNFAALSSSGGAAGAVVSLPDTTWGALSAGLTVQINAQDITSGLSLSTGDYMVDYSTNGGVTFNVVSSTFQITSTTPYVSMTGTAGTTAVQTFSVKNLGLVQSEEDTDTPVRNKVRFTAKDQARNLFSTSTVSFNVRVDTTTPGALTALTPLTPYASGQVQLNWVAPGNNNGTGNLVTGSAFHLMYTTDPVLAAGGAFWNPSNPQVTISTFAVRLTSHTTLLSGLINGGTVYYFRAFAKDPSGNFSPLSLGATAATLAPPAVPTALADVVTNASTITWTWNQTVLTSSYTVFADTDTTNGLVTFSTPVGGTASFARTGLSTNTQYGVIVAGRNPAGLGVLTSGVSDYTLAAAPGTPVMSSVSYSSVTFSWAANGNPGYTNYEITQSTDNFSTNFSTPTPFAAPLVQTSTTFLNLRAGTTYYFRTRAQNRQNLDPGAIKTAFSSATALTETLPTNAVGVSSAVLGISSVTWTWTNTGGGATQFRVFTTTNGAQLANNLDSGPDRPSEFAGYWPLDGGIARDILAGTMGALTGPPAPIAGQVVGALSFANTDYAVAPFAAAPTGASARTLAAWVKPSDVSGNYYIAGWGNGDTTGQAFYLELRPGGQFAVVGVGADLIGVGGTATVGNYYFVVGTYDGTKSRLYVNGVEDVLSPATVGLNTSAGSLNIGRFSATTPVCCFKGSIDEVGVYSKALTLSEINALYQRGLAGKPFHGNKYSSVSLATNTLYGVYVEAFVPAGSGGFTAQTPAYTLAAAPGAPALAVVAGASATVNSLGAGWNANGNPTYTAYEISLATDSAFSGVVSTPVAFAAAATTNTYTFTGLTQGSSYFFRIQARNNEPVGPVPTAFSSVGQSQTLPLAVSGLAFSTATVAATSAKWTWGDNGNGGATQYRAFQAVDGGAETLFASGVVGSTFTESALLANHHYGLRMEPYTQTGIAAQTISVGGYTLAQPPASLAVTSITSGTVSLSWNANGNSNFTRYEVRRSTDDFQSDEVVAVTYLSNLTLTTATVGSLAPFTTYYFKVRAANDIHPVVPADSPTPVQATKTAYSLTVSTVTGAPVIQGIAGTALGVSSIAWSWNPVFGADGYDVLSSTSGTIIVSTSVASFDSTGLSTNTAYGIQVRAFNNLGTGFYSSLVTRYTLAATPAQPSFLPVGTTTVSLTWGTQGNPGGTVYELSASVDGFSANFSTPIAFAQAFTASATTLAGLLSGTTYTYRVRAQNNEPTSPPATAFSGSASTRTLSVPAAITDLFGSSFYPGRIDLTWTAPGFNGGTGYINDGLYAINYSTKASDMLSASATTQAPLKYSAVISAGVQESTSINVPSLRWGDTFFISIFVRNDEGIFSAKSNTVSRLAPPQVLAFTIDLSSFSLVTLPLSSSAVIGTPVTLVSTGNVSTSYVLQAATSTNIWRLAESANGFPNTEEDLMRLAAAFHPTLPASFTAFTSGGASISVSTNPRTASGLNGYSLGTDSGAGIPPSPAPGPAQTRKLWYGIETPPYSTTASSQTFQVIITATTP